MTLNSSQHQVTDDAEMPDWLNAGSIDLLDPFDSPRPIQRTVRELLHDQFAIAFERILEKITAGYTLTNAVREDFREFEVGAFQRWMKKDPERLQRYDEAKEIRTETWAGKIIAIAEAVDNPLEDVQRSKLKIDTYRWLMGADNRRRYGDIKQVEVTQNISITAALEAAQQRVLTATIVSDEEMT
ncbi:MAG: hypothetical protein WC551_10995 [Patescibacteria group bacterium]